MRFIWVSFFLVFCSSYFSLLAVSSVFFYPNEGCFVLENDFIRRVISLTDSGISTSSYKIKHNGFDLSKAPSNEFSFCLNGHFFYGNRNFSLSDYRIEKEFDGYSLVIFLRNPVCGVKVHYRIYDNHAVIRKCVCVSNVSDERCILSDLFWERLFLDPSGGKDLMGHFGSYLFTTPYAGGRYDPAVLFCGDMASVILGNEAPGILKYTGLYTLEQDEVCIGMNGKGDNYPFVYTLGPDSSFSSPYGFILSTTKRPVYESFDYDLARFVREVLPIRLFQKQSSPRFLYNTWMPFRYSINDTLLFELADHVSQMGADYFAIDDGWQTFYGDWEVDSTKFPNGLRPVFDSIRAKGMEPGIWFAPTTLDARCKVYHEFSDCSVTDKDGNPSNLHGWLNNYPAYTMDITNPKWYNYILSRLKFLISEYGIRYVKIDLSVIKSAYVTVPVRSGSYKSTVFSSGREEYLYRGYEQLARFSDDLYAAFPDLIIDYTYELWGDHHTIDYFLTAHADLDWISNFNAYDLSGMQEVRNLCRQRGRVLPSSSMLIGNMCFDAPESLTAFVSGFGSTPLMLGDARVLSDKQKRDFKFYADWFKSMVARYDILPYYQTGGIFNEVRDGCWDGFARFNTTLSGGILCLFRNHSVEGKRMVTLPFVNSDSRYILKDASGKIIGRFSGKVLKEKGVSVSIKAPNGFAAIEIAPL